uniref:Uncharacterized protein n=1 Tax=viral metagenome TaxID=1070528 RepID=A0A6C0M1Q3_9ZZZZ
MVYKLASITELLQLIHPNLKIKNDSVMMLNNMISDHILHDLIVNNNILTVDIIKAHILTITNDKLLQDHAFNEINKSLTNLGLNLTLLKQDTIDIINEKYGISVNEDNVVTAITTLIEYILAEILELSGNITISNRRVYVTKYNIIQSIKDDEALNDLFK